MSDIKNNYATFESFVSQYPKYLELSKKFNKSPELILDLMAKIGDEVLTRTSDEILKTISENLKTFISVRDVKLSDNAMQSLDNLYRFLKDNNQKRG
jgi:hypothetical protein